MDYPAVLWVDSSIRFNVEPDALSDLYKHILTKTKGFTFFKNNVRPQLCYECTHPDMYKFIPSDQERLKSLPQFCACIMMFYRTEWVITNALYWYVTGALNKPCIEPAGSQKTCKRPGKGPRGPYLDCHRYDQSLINMVVSNELNYHVDSYLYDKHIMRMTWKKAA